VDERVVCALCFTSDPKKLCIDHDHSTGQVRGLLCHSCNAGLGAFNDDIQLLHRAMAYVRKGMIDFMNDKTDKFARGEVSSWD
jgi:hypothetical protein